MTFHLEPIEMSRRTDVGGQDPKPLSDKTNMFTTGHDYITEMCLMHEQMFFFMRDR